MADEITPRLNLVKPEVGGSADTWGDKWNENADKIDAMVVRQSDVGTAATRDVGTGADQVPTNGMLGTAATRDVTTGPADTTPGRLLKVGDLGSNKRPGTKVDFNELPELYPYSGAVPVMSDAGSTNAPPNGGNIYYYVEQHFFEREGNVTQIAIPYRVDSDGLWMRSRFRGEWSPWRKIYHSGNIAQLISDGDLVQTSRTISTGTGLTGGGDLSANRTISLASSHWPIGVGQTWQRMGTSRALGTTYTNTTGRPIMVAIKLGGTDRDFSFYVDDVLVAAGVTLGDKLWGWVWAIVPPGSTYKVISDSNDYGWAELR